MRVAVLIYSMMSLYMLIPLIPPLHLLMPLNESRPYIHLFDIDYSFDREMYYYPTLLNSYVTIVAAVSTMVVTDTSYIALVQHACGLFAAIGSCIVHRHQNHSFLSFSENFNLIQRNTTIFSLFSLYINIRFNFLVNKLLIVFQRCRLENLTSERRKASRYAKDVEVVCKKCELTNHDDKIYRELIFLLQKHQLILEWVLSCVATHRVPTAGYFTYSMWILFVYTFQICRFVRVLVSMVFPFDDLFPFHHYESLGNSNECAIVKLKCCRSEIIFDRSWI